MYCLEKCCRISFDTLCRKLHWDWDNFPLIYTLNQIPSHTHNILRLVPSRHLFISAQEKTWRRFGFSSAFILLMHREFTKSSPLITARIQRSDWVWVCNIPERPADIKPYDQSLAPFVLKAWTRTWYFVFLKSPLNKQFLPSGFVVQLCQVLLSTATSAR